MSSLLTRKWYLFIAFGFFFSCITPDNLRQAKLQLDDNRPAEALSLVNQYLRTNSNDIEGFYLKGYIHHRFAESYKNPVKQTPQYRKMKEAFAQTDSIAYQRQLTNFAKPKINNLLRSSWSTQYRAALSIWENDSTRTREDLSTAAAHISNAGTILPDSAQTFILAANIYEKLGMTQDAMQSLEQYQNYKSEDDTLLNETLFFLQLKKGSLPNTTTFSTRLDTTQHIVKLKTLANTYIANDKHASSVTILRQLTEEEPQQYKPYHALSVQYYLRFESWRDNLARQYLRVSDSVRVQKEAHYLEALADSSSHYFRQAFKRSSESLELAESGATIHQNLGIAFRELREKPPFNRFVADSTARHFFRQAAQYFEPVAMADTTRNEPTNRLFQLYVAAGMTPKADSLYRKTTYHQSSK